MTDTLICLTVPETIPTEITGFGSVRGNNMEEKLNIPEHIAFIMDGNGRWAQQRGKERCDGHRAGAQSLDNITRVCYDKGIKNITFYAFSTENWKRPADEVAGIMGILSDYLDKMIMLFERGEEELYRHTRVRFIGDTGVFSLLNRNKIKKITEISEKVDIKMTLDIAINYGGRSDIVNAVNRFISENKGKKVSESDISDRLYTSGQPDPDLIIRTGGEMRLSNFLLWQAAYSEYYSTQALWPDFGESDLDAAIEEYNRRTRKFGGLAKK